MGAHQLIRCMWKTGPIPRTTSFSPTLCGAISLGRNAVYPEGHHGNAVLLRYPIEHYENRDVSVDGAERRRALLPHCAADHRKSDSCDVRTSGPA
ncbi:hypothetical protein ACNKHU_04510 [Shigella flexneri]